MLFVATEISIAAQESLYHCSAHGDQHTPSDSYPVAMRGKGARTVKCPSGDVSYAMLSHSNRRRWKYISESSPKYAFASFFLCTVSMTTYWPKYELCPRSTIGDHSDGHWPLEAVPCQYQKTKLLLVHGLYKSIVEVSSAIATL